MFKKKSSDIPTMPVPPSSSAERVTSVLGAGVVWKGHVAGSGGVRIEGSFDGDINLRGMLVVGETGKVTCQQIRASSVIISGAVRADITAERVEIRSTGRVWGNVTTAAFATDEGAFLRGQITMEERIELGPLPNPEDAQASA